MFAATCTTTFIVLTSTTSTVSLPASVETLHIALIWQQQVLLVLLLLLLLLLVLLLLLLLLPLQS